MQPKFQALAKTKEKWMPDFLEVNERTIQDGTKLMTKQDLNIKYS